MVGFPDCVNLTYVPKQELSGSLEQVPTSTVKGTRTPNEQHKPCNFSVAYFGPRVLSALESRAIHGGGVVLVPLRSK